MKIYLTGFANWNPRLRSRLISCGIPRCAQHINRTTFQALESYRPPALAGLLSPFLNLFCFSLPISLIQERYRQQNQAQYDERDYAIEPV